MEERKEEMFLFKDALITMVICVGHMVKDHSDNEREGKECFLFNQTYDKGPFK